LTSSSLTKVPQPSHWLLPPIMLNPVR
jgi:hypothetical protein